jgi:hypothetical protein
MCSYQYLLLVVTSTYYWYSVIWYYYDIVLYIYIVYYHIYLYYDHYLYIFSILILSIYINYNFDNMPILNCYYDDFVCRWLPMNEVELIL